MFIGKVDTKTLKIHIRREDLDLRPITVYKILCFHASNCQIRVVTGVFEQSVHTFFEAGFFEAAVLETGFALDAGFGLDVGLALEAG
jgi:hypothetical protein